MCRFGLDAFDRGLSGRFDLVVGRLQVRDLVDMLLLFGAEGLQAVFILFSLKPRLCKAQCHEPECSDHQCSRSRGRRERRHGRPDRTDRCHQLTDADDHLSDDHQSRPESRHEEPDLYYRVLLGVAEAVKPVRPLLDLRDQFADLRRQPVPDRDRRLFQGGLQNRNLAGQIVLHRLGHLFRCSFGIRYGVRQGSEILL